MARIEELPDDFDESLDLNKAPEPEINPLMQASEETPFGIKEDALDKEPSTTPAMPPGMASVKSHTADEILKLMNQTPLFMTDVEQASADGENIELEAIRALQNEGTRADVADGFRETGNELAKAKRWSDAKEFYSKGIATFAAENVWEKPEDPKKEAQREKKIEEACYINRALCNLELKNYRSTTLDCAGALRINPKNVKAYYRSGCALFTLDKIDQAEDACTRGIHLDPSNKSLKILASKISSRKELLEKKAAKKRAEEERIRKEKFTLQTALRARGIKTRETSESPDLDDAAMKLSPDPLSPESAVVFPCVLLYPMHAQSDFIKEFAETQTISDHLDYIFPLPWDEKGEYTIGSVDCYIQTSSGGMIKPGKKVSLLSILMGGKVEVVDGLVKINVVPTAQAGKWIAEMKARKSA